MGIALANDDYGNPIQTLKQGVLRLRAVGIASAQSVAFTAGTKVVRLCSTTNCWINFGANPTAAATDGNGAYLPAGAVEFWRVVDGDKVAVIRDTADGNLSITEMV